MGGPRKQRLVVLYDRWSYSTISTLLERAHEDARKALGNAGAMALRA